jgi:hypothetical protein
MTFPYYFNQRDGCNAIVSIGTKENRDRQIETFGKKKEKEKEKDNIGRQYRLQRFQSDLRVHICKGHASLNISPGLYITGIPREVDNHDNRHRHRIKDIKRPFMLQRIPVVSKHILNDAEN